MTTCIGEPISWLRLERFALGAPDAAIDAHLGACAVCRGCFDEIQRDEIALPSLAATVRVDRRIRRWVAPALAVLGAAAVAIVIARQLSHRPASEGGGRRALEGLGTVAVKGVGEVGLELVRERGGEIRFDASHYARGDRWKVIVTCPPAAAAWIEVWVSDGATIDHPLAPAQLACGNRVVVPGAFTITGLSAQRVCARVSSVPGAPGATACTTLRPE